MNAIVSSDVSGLPDTDLAVEFSRDILGFIDPRVEDDNGHPVIVDHAYRVYPGSRFHPDSLGDVERRIKAWCQIVCLPFEQTFIPGPHGRDWLDGGRCDLPIASYMEWCLDQRQLMIRERFGEEEELSDDQLAAVTE